MINVDTIEIGDVIRLKRKSNSYYCIVGEIGEQFVVEDKISKPFSNYIVIREKSGISRCIWKDGDSCALFDLYFPIKKLQDYSI